MIVGGKLKMKNQKHPLLGKRPVRDGANEGKFRFEIKEKKVEDALMPPEFEEKK